MIVIMLTALFATAAIVACAAITATIRRYGRSALALRETLQRVNVGDDISLRISEITVTMSEPNRVIRPDFTRRSNRLEASGALRAAA